MIRRVNRPVIVTDQFVTFDFGCDHLLKTCDFIGRYRARILEISESVIHVRIGPTWLSFWSRKSEVAPVDVLIEIESDGHPAGFPTSSNPDERFSKISVTVRSRERLWRIGNFEETAHQLLRSLRHSLMAC